MLGNIKFNSDIVFAAESFEDIVEFKNQNSLSIEYINHDKHYTVYVKKNNEKIMYIEIFKESFNKDSWSSEEISKNSLALLAFESEYLT